jgi:hypothetical protein
MRYFGFFINLLIFLFNMSLGGNLCQAQDLYHPSSNQFTDTLVDFAWNPFQTNSSIDYKLVIAGNRNLTQNRQEFYTNQSSLKVDVNEGLNYWKVYARNQSQILDSSKLDSFNVFSPTFIDSILFWVKSDTGLIINNQFVSQWSDISGNSNHLTQSVSSRQGVYIDPVLNGYGALRLDGTTDVYNFSHGITNNNYGIYILYNYRGTTANKRMINGSNNWILGPFGGTFRLFDGGFVSGPVTDSNYILHSAYAINDTLTNFVNGITYGSRSGGFSPGSTLTLSVNFLDSDILEIIMFEGTVSRKDHDHLTSYLLDKYAPPVNLGADRLVCNFPDSIFTTIDYALDFKWNTGDSTRSIQIDSAGTYRLTITDIFGRTSTDSVLVLKDTADYRVDFPFTDTTICKGEQITISAGGPRYRYLWNTSRDSNVITIDSAGLYNVQVTNCINNSSMDSFVVYVNEPVFDLGTDTVFCFNTANSIMPDSNFVNVSYQWSNGLSSASIQPNTSGLYILTVTDQYGCRYSDSIQVRLDSSLFGLTLGPDTALCEGNEIGLLNPNDSVLTYSYSGGSTSPTQLVDTSGIYTVLLSSNLCQVHDTINVTIKGLAPQADFSFQHLCFGDTVVFNDSSVAPAGDSIVAYEWDFGDGNSSGAANPLNSYPGVNDYQVFLKITTDKGCIDTVSKNLQILPLPEPAFSIQNKCSGVPIYFQDQSQIFTGQIVDWRYAFGDPADPAAFSTQPNTSYTYGNAGSYTITLITESAAGCVDSISRTKVVNPTPAVDFSVNGYCLGDSTRFLDQTILPPAKVKSYDWFVGNIQANSRNLTLKFSSTGIKYPILRVISDSNCVGVGRDTIEIVGRPNAKINFNDACLGDSVHLEDQSQVAPGDVLSRSILTFDGMVDSAFSSKSFLLKQAKDYALKLNVLTEKGCRDSLQKVVSVKPLPQASFTILNNGSGAPYDLLINNTSQNASSYQWTSGHGQNSTAPVPDFNYGQAGEYRLELIAINSFACTDTFARTLSVTPYFLDAALEELFLEEDPQGNLILFVTVSNKGNNTIEEVSLQILINGETILVEDKTLSVYKGSSTGFFLNTRVVQSPTDKIDFVCVTISSVNGGSDEITSNNELCTEGFSEEFTFAAYPNPASEQLTLTYVAPENGTLTIRLLDQLGREVLLPMDEVVLQKGFYQQRLTLTPLKNGSYTIWVDFNGEIKQYRILKY